MHPFRPLLSRATSRIPAVLLVLAACATGAGARVLEVGEGRPYALPSDAAKDAEPGDTIRIASGTYYDCAVWEDDGLTIEGEGPDVVITDTVCKGKGIFVIQGDGVVVRNVTLQRARVPDGNGAGIRAEGANLTVEDSRFINNENGILATPGKAGTIRILRSEFKQNGSCEGSGGCAHGIYVNKAELLEIRDSVFHETRAAHHVKSRAMRTVLEGNNITDGEAGTSSYLVDVPNGGAVVLRNNFLQKGPKTENWSAAVKIGAEGVRQPTDEILIVDNVFVNDTGKRVVLVDNLTATPAVLQGNELSGKVEPLKGDGTVD